MKRGKYLRRNGKNVYYFQKGEKAYRLYLPNCYGGMATAILP